MERYISKFISIDLANKAALLSGSRQVGKTTLANSIYGEGSEYLNYDIIKDR